MMLKLPSTLGTFIRTQLDAASLQLRLILGMILIFTLGLGSLTLWIDGQLQHLISDRDRVSVPSFPLKDSETQRLISARLHLRNMSIFSWLTTLTCSAWFIRRSLLPLRQIVKWTEREPALQPIFPDFRQSPHEIKTLEQNWSILLNQFSQVQEQHQQLTNNLAHELRTPLSLIYGYLQRTQQQSQNLNEVPNEALGMAVEEAERMTQLLQDWLDLTRSSPYKRPFAAEPLCLNEVIREVAEMTEKFEHRRIDYDLPPFPLRIAVDRPPLLQILNHLLKNALDYSEKQEPVKIQLSQVQQWAVIEVRDRGYGIPLAEQARIFDPLYRVDHSRTRATGGSGLGLSIVKRWVEEMGGEVTVQSELGLGSTFRIKLPLFENQSTNAALI